MDFPAGWYDDPQHPTQQRYWDGSAWTDERRPREQPSPYQGQYGQPAQPSQGQPQYGQPLQHGQVFGGAQQQPPSDRPVYGQPGPQQPHQQLPAQYGQPTQQHGYPAYPQQQAGYGYAGQKPSRVATPDGQMLSGWWRRFFARFIDGILSGLIAMVLSGYFIYKYVQWFVDWAKPILDSMSAGQPPVVPGTLPAEAYKWLIPISIIQLLVTFAYEYFFLTKAGATPGKMLLGIAVRLRERPGNPPNAAAAKRAGFNVGLNILGFVPVIGQVTLLVMLLNYLWPLWDDRRQALHDKWPDTNVVRR